jgi:hypothetical protein
VPGTPLQGLRDGIEKDTFLTIMVCEQLGTALMICPFGPKVTQLECVSAADAVIDVSPKLAKQASTASSFLMYRLLGLSTRLQ